ncbi:unnamed protein product, partial [Ectocarpus fasciculatus]
KVIVVGATNRPDSLDPALRRPGRFDRELAFPLPTRRARRDILRVHTKDWKPPMDPALEDELAELTAGYCGADMKALCSEATLLAVRRRYPQIYASEEKLLLDAKSVKVTRSHFLGALRGLTPSSQREGINPARPLPPHLSALLSDSLAVMSETLQVQFPQGSHGKDLGGGASDNGEGGGVDDDDDDHDHSWSDEEDRDDSSSSSSCASCSSSSSDDDNSGGGESGDRALGSRKKKKRLGGGHRRHRRGETAGMPPLGSNNPALSSVPGGDVGKQQAGLRISGGGGGGLLPGGKGRGTDAGVGSTWVHRPRLALHGPPGCGQTQLAAAALHLLDGVPVHSLALHSLHGDPSRTAEASLVSRFVEARRNVPSVLYLPGAHQWWDGEDEAAAVHPHLRTLLINLLDDIPDTWPILVVSTWETKPEDGGNGGGGGSALGDYSYNMAASASRSGSSKQLISALLGGSRAEEGPWGLGVSGGGGAWGGGGAAGGGGSVDVYGEEGERVGWNGAIEMTLTGDKQREGFAEEMLSTLAGTLRKAFCARGSRGGRAKKTPPPPLPLAPLPERQEEREEPEDESLKKQEEHYLRELRICLREVLGELRKDRRFSMFKQIGDYEGEFMDLNGIRDKLNAEEYVTLDDFEEDLKLMAEEAKEVRDRLKANLARAEANASALEGARGAAASEGAAGGGGAPGGAGRGSGAGGGDDVGLRRALMEVDRATNQLARAATAVDMACFLRDAALSFLQE